ncbi:MAG: hypothetical protein AAF959_06715 [Cyanobacteria bacterium P01_D01_bin.56]
METSQSEERLSAEVSVRNVKADRDPNISDSARDVVDSLFRAGMSLVDIPINVLPQKPRRHIQKARREFTLGVSALTREVADVIADTMPKQD